MKMFVFGFVLLACLIFVHLHGFVYHFSDETFVLYPAARVAAGAVLYRDTIVTYTPAAIWVVAVAFRSFGVSVLTGRLVMVVVSLLGAIGVFKLTGRLEAVVVYLFWGPFQINFPAPGMFAIVSGVWTCLALQKRRYFWAGVLVILTFLFKQNFGLAIFITSCFYLWGKSYRGFFLGISCSVFSVAFYLLLTNSLGPFIGVFYTYTFQKYLVERVTDTPVRNFVYLWPAFVAVWYIYTKRTLRSDWFLGVFLLSFWLLGIRPVADYVHLVPIIALSGILVSALNRPVTLALAILGLYFVLFGNYYRWGPPIRQQNFFDSDPRALVYSTASLTGDKREIISAVRQTAGNRQEIYVNGYAPWIYFFSERGNATRFEYVTPNILTPAWSAEIARDLEAKKVPLVLTVVGSEQNDYYEMSYIRSHYYPISVVRGFRFWRRNEA